MYETEPYVQRPTELHQCFEYVTHNTRCTETAIRGEYFCPTHRISPAPIYLHPDGGFTLPPLTGRDCILKVAAEIAQRLAWNTIDTKRAGKILYACQLANSALDGKLRDQKAATAVVHRHSEPQAQNLSIPDGTETKSTEDTARPTTFDLNAADAKPCRPLFHRMRNHTKIRQSIHEVLRRQRHQQQAHDANQHANPRIAQQPHHAVRVPQDQIAAQRSHQNRYQNRRQLPVRLRLSDEHHHGCDCTG